MEFKLVLSLILILFNMSVLHAWTELYGDIRGIVTNQESGQVIRGATIKLIPFNSTDNIQVAKSFSQDAGEFLFKDITPGLYNLECSAFGFKTTKLVGVQVREDRTKLAYFKMERGSAAEMVEVYTYAALEAKQKAITQTSTASKEALEDAPATIYVITAQDIEDNGYMSLNEVLADIPEFEIQNRASPKENNIVSARGIDGNDKLLILRNGSRQSSMVDTKYSLMENYGIRYVERIEVILGPASALYGADAYMGVVNIITTSGHDSKNISLTGSYGNYNTTSNAFRMGWGSEKVSFALEVGGFYTEGVDLNNVYKQEFQLYNQNYLTNGTVLLNQFDSNKTKNIPIKPFSLERKALYVNSRFDYKKFNFNLSFNQEHHSSSVSTLPQYSPYWQESRFGNTIINVSINQGYAFKTGSKWSTSTNATSTLNTITTNSNFLNVHTNYKKAYKAGGSIGARIKQTLGYQFHPNHGITVGVELQHSTSLPHTGDLPRKLSFLDALSIIDPSKEDIYYLGSDALTSDNNSLKIYQKFYYMQRWVAASFIEYRANIKNKLLLTIGSRYDAIFDIAMSKPNEKVTLYSNVSPRLGIIYKPIQNLNFKFFGGEGFIQPSPESKYEHYGTLRPTSDGKSLKSIFWRVPNPNLRAERLVTTELSSTYSKGDFTISTNGYINILYQHIAYQHVEGDSFLLSEQSIPVGYKEMNVNSEEDILAYGATLKAAYRLVYGQEEQLKIKFKASYTFADGAMSSYAHLPFTAKHTVKAGILFKYKNLSFNNNFLFRTSSYSDAVVTSTNKVFQYQNPSFFVWNAYAYYKILNKKKFSLSIFAKVNNVLNNRYYNVTSHSSIALGASPQDPIRFLIGLSANFGNKK